jgi:hypothetical protein
VTQRLTPTQLQGRVYAAVEFLITTPQTISIALGAALITVAGYRSLLLAMAVVITLAAVYLLSRPEQRPAPRPFLRAARSTAAGRHADCASQENCASQETHCAGREHTDAV